MRIMERFKERTIRNRISIRKEDRSSRRYNRTRLWLLSAFIGFASASGCVNIFDPIDSPSGDRQLLSAARAAFDKGDIATARELYGKVSSEEATSEGVFLDLDSCGADIAAFATALSQASGATSNPGILITVMAEKMYRQVSSSCFATLLAAYKRSRTIQNISLRGFTSFMAAIAIAGEVMGSNNALPSDGILNKSDFIGNTSTCTTFPGTCTSCTKGDGISAAAAVDLSSSGTTSITATWGVLQGAINAANTALTELNISAGASYSLISQLASGTPGVDNTYRCLLTSLGVGR